MLSFIEQSRTKLIGNTQENNVPINYKESSDLWERNIKEEKDTLLKKLNVNDCRKIRRQTFGRLKMDF